MRPGTPSCRGFRDTSRHQLLGRSTGRPPENENVRGCHVNAHGPQHGGHRLTPSGILAVRRLHTHEGAVQHCRRQWERGIGTLRSRGRGGGGGQPKPLGAGTLSYLAAANPSAIVSPGGTPPCLLHVASMSPCSMAGSPSASGGAFHARAVAPRRGSGRRGVPGRRLPTTHRRGARVCP